MIEIFCLAQRGAQLTNEACDHLETLSIYTAGQAMLLSQRIYHEVQPGALALATVARHPPVLGENGITAALCWRSYRGGCLQTAVRGQHEAQQLTAGHRDPEQKRLEAQTGGVGADSALMRVVVDSSHQDTRYATCRDAGDGV